MKKKKYKTLKLIILFIILAIAFFQVGKFASKQLATKKYDDITTNMLIIQKKVKMINGETKVNVENEGFVGKKVSELENEKIKEAIIKLGITEEEFEDYYVLYMNDFETMGISDELKKANSEEYIISYKNIEVIYIKGIKADEKTYYKLSDILNKDKKEESKSEEELENSNEESNEENSEESSEETEENSEEEE